MNHEKIGEMNGKWAMLLKIQLASLPVITTLLGWLLVAVIGVMRDVAVIEGNRFDATDAHEMERRIDERFDKMPPTWFVDRMDKIEHRLEKLEEKIK